MKIYADLPIRKSRQMIADGAVALSVVLWVGLGRLVYRTVHLLAVPGHALEGAGNNLSRSLRTAAAGAARLPFIGSSLSAPLKAAGRAAGLVAHAGAAEQSAAARLALLLGLIIALLPIALTLLAWLPGRLKWIRSAGAAAQFRELDEDLLALRALTRHPLWELQRIDARPAAAYAAGDRSVIGRLAALELGAIGLRASDGGRPGSARGPG